MSTVERIFLAILFGLLVAGLSAAGSILFHLDHVWPGVVVGFAIGAKIDFIRARKK
jgi:hypothetical protein